MVQSRHGGRQARGRVAGLAAGRPVRVPPPAAARASPAGAGLPPGYGEGGTALGTERQPPPGQRHGNRLQRGFLGFRGLCGLAGANAAKVSKPVPGHRIRSAMGNARAARDAKTGRGGRSGRQRRRCIGRFTQCGEKREGVEGRGRVAHAALPGFSRQTSLRFTGGLPGASTTSVAPFRRNRCPWVARTLTARDALSRSRSPPGPRW